MEFARMRASPGVHTVCGFLLDSVDSCNWSMFITVTSKRTAWYSENMNLQFLRFKLEATPNCRRPLGSGYLQKCRFFQNSCASLHRKLEKHAAIPTLEGPLFTQKRKIPNHKRNYWKHVAARLAPPWSASLFLWCSCFVSWQNMWGTRTAKRLLNWFWKIKTSFTIKSCFPNKNWQPTCCLGEVKC